MSHLFSLNSFKIGHFTSSTAFKPLLWFLTCKLVLILSGPMVLFSSEIEFEKPCFFAQIVHPGKAIKSSPLFKSVKMEVPYPGEN